MYQATNISYRIRNKVLLEKVNMVLHPGIFTAVVGPNGAGKSTLLKTMAYEHQQFLGEITINGKSAGSYTPRTLSIVRSVLPQNPQVQFSFSAEQIIQLGRHAHRATKNTNREIIEEVMGMTGTLSLRDRTYNTLSGGERQRVQLARVLAQVWEETVYPRYILLDEPTSSQDIAQQQLILKLARLACARNIGVMAIIHDLNQAVQFADQLYFMREGSIVAEGSAQMAFTKANIESTFCCRVNVYHDPCNNCPYIIPERETESDHLIIGK